MSNKDYKNTLNLPATDFPMKAELAKREPAMLEFWQKIDIYQKLRQQGKGRQKFIVHDGPPYANGNIHTGHALNKILKDIIAKAKTLSGFDSPFVPGWDCHGLPIELNVEKQIGKVGATVTAEKFRQACRDYANNQINIQREQFKRLGVIGDWNNPYRTMDYKFEADIVRLLAMVLENGHIEQGFKPVYWCVDCGSALAEAEVEYANKVSPAIDVRFQVVDENDFWQRINAKMTGKGAINVPIWTTTPWTLPANEAVALNPKVRYLLIQTNQAGLEERLILAEALLAESLKRYKIEDYQELARFTGEALQGLIVRHPFYDRKVPVVLGEHVTVETGTGAVHTAPAHGQEDYLVGQHYHLPLVNPVGRDGRFLPNTALFAGESVFKTNPKIIEVLQQHNKLLAQEKLEHSYPHCWRHKTPLIFLATPQWFVTLNNPLRQHAIRAAGEVEWLPQWGMMNMTSMIAKRPDWCISRQRNWGTPITLLIHKESQQLYPHMTEVMYRIAERVEKEGIEAWFKSTPEDWLGEEGKNYLKINDVLDVWFDAGTTHYAVLRQRPELHYPADVVLEGSDQYRGWFQSLLLTAIGQQVKAHNAKEQNAQPPYKTVITHGFLLDEKGRKMSKSMGNDIPPEKVWNSLGADILRLWVSSSDYTSEIAFSEEILKRLTEAYRRIRNTARYFLANLFDFDPAKDLVPSEKMLSLDLWIVERAAALQQQILLAYDKFDFHFIYQAVHNFCIVELGSFYLDIIKDRQYTTQKNSLARRSAQTALYHLAEAIVRWLTPILSFTAEEIWRYLPGQREESVLLARWYENLPAAVTAQTIAPFTREEFWGTLMAIRDIVNKEIEKCRNEGEVGSSLEAEVTLYCPNDSQLMQALKLLGNELRFVLITSHVDLVAEDQCPRDAVCYNLLGQNLRVKVVASSQPKCARCWHRRKDVGQNQEHPEICMRCVENVVEAGEIRNFA